MIHYKTYDYAVDVWSVGCILASMTFKKHPFFGGKNNDDQLLEIVKFLGSEGLMEYIRKYDIKVSEELLEDLRGYEKQEWRSLVNEENSIFVDDKLVELLEKIFVYDHVML